MLGIFNLLSFHSNPVLGIPRTNKFKTTETIIVKQLLSNSDMINVPQVFDSIITD